MIDSRCVKFRNEEGNGSIGTARLHLEVLHQYGKVIWGQWSTSGSLIPDSTYKEMNQEPFFLYAFDRNAALLKMHVIEVLRKEEVIEKGLQYLIPSYYSVNNPTSAFYLLDDIQVLPVEYSKYLSSQNGTSVYKSNNINSTRPWKIYETVPFENIVLNNNQNQEQITLLKEPHKNIVKQSVTPIEPERCYSVYSYTEKMFNKKYIGMTNNVKRRRSEHENPSNWKKESGKFLYVGFAIFGIDDFEFEILHENLTEEEAHYWEAYEIEKTNSYYPNGFNSRNESRYLK